MRFQQFIKEDESLSEILRLKPEFAKEKAKKALKQIRDDIARAIEKHGEDSKVVQYLRAKKKKLAMAEAEERVE